MPKKLWKDELIIDTYIMAHSGYKNVKIAEALGISIETFKLWGKNKPVFKAAVVRGRKTHKQELNGGANFKKYVYNQLSPKIKKLWDKIDECEDEKAPSIKRIEALLKKGGKRARQHIFIYAWTESSFDISNALRKANISLSTFKQWVEEEPPFAKLVDEIQWHKKNFYEAGLNKLVASGNPMIIAFANKTINADRGFAERMKVDIDAHVETTMKAEIPISKLDLDTKTKKIVLAAIRKYKKEHPDD